MNIRSRIQVFAVSLLCLAPFVPIASAEASSFQPQKNGHRDRMEWEALDRSSGIVARELVHRHVYLRDVTGVKTGWVAMAGQGW
jgi:hypothetical protein